MTITRRRILAASAAAPLAAPWIAGTARAETKKLKISHQFPGGTVDTGDFRDQLCRRFAAELEKRTKGALGAEVYPNSSLVKTVAQYSAIRRGALDMTLYPLNYAGGEVGEYNIGFMPGVVSSYDQGYAWKKAEIGKKMNALMAEKGAVLVTFFFVFEPLLMSKQVFDALPKDQQTAIMDIGAEMEKFAIEKAKADDDEVAKVYEKRGIKTYEIDQAEVDKWKAVAAQTCWKEFADKNASNAEFLKLSQQVS